MLTPEEFTVGPIGDITQLTLVLPIDRYGHACLITAAPGKPTALVVDEKDTFAFFVSEGYGMERPPDTKYLSRNRRDERL
jgi:hypothetical protein